MGQLKNYLSGLCGDIFRLLPMKEDECLGVENHIPDYIESLIINMTGAMSTYPTLSSQKQYLRVLNNIQYLKTGDVDFAKWRKVILNSVKSVEVLADLYEEGKL